LSNYDLDAGGSASKKGGLTSGIAIARNSSFSVAFTKMGAWLDQEERGKRKKGVQTLISSRNRPITVGGISIPLHLPNAREGLKR